jgi:transaldolase
MASPLKQLHDAGVSIWLDTLSRELLRSGRFDALIRDYGVSGATSNPTIFAKAITSSNLYDDQIERLASRHDQDPRDLFFDLALDDVKDAAYRLRAQYERSGGRVGFVSFECTPDLAYDSQGTVAQAMDLWQRLGQPNVMIKVPGTEAALPAIEELTRRGVNINITLLFSLERYERVIDAYIRGLAARADAGEPVDRVTSVASMFLSRIDTKVDAQVPEGSHVRGTVALATARMAYQRYLSRHASADWERLARLGARRQRPLWASTATKNPAYSDVLYVSELIGPDVIATIPEGTLRAFADHGIVARTLDADPAAARRALADVAAAGVDLGLVADELEREGVQAFCDSFDELRDCIAGKAHALVA